MQRRQFLAGPLGLVITCHVTRSTSLARTSAAADRASLPVLDLTLSDTGFEIVQPLAAGRYEAVVANAGTLTDSHFALGKIPDEVTDSATMSRSASNTCLYA